MLYFNFIYRNNSNFVIYLSYSTDNGINYGKPLILIILCNLFYSNNITGFCFIFLFVDMPKVNFVDISVNQVLV